MDKIFNPGTECISVRKTRVWRAIQVTGSDGLETQDDNEVALKDIRLDMGSQTEKQNQESIYTELREIKKKKLNRFKRSYKKQVKEVLKNIPYSLPFP